jgi:hypothetical protein
MFQIDPARLEQAVATLPGAVLYALIQIYVLVKSGRMPTAQDWIGVAANITCALACGLLLGFVLQGAIEHIPMAFLRDPFVIGTLIGAFGWELFPFAWEQGRNFARRRLEKVAQGD